MKKKFKPVASVALNCRDLFWLPDGVTHLSFRQDQAEYFVATDPRLQNHDLVVWGDKYLPVRGNCFYLSEFGFIDRGRYHYGKIIWFTRCKGCQNDVELKSLSADGRCPRCITVTAAGKREARMVPL
jgi:hypothetical protein